MERIAAILAMFVLLMSGRHPDKRLPQQPTALTIEAVPLGPPSRVAETKLGDLRWLGGWVLRSEAGGFGGLSAMRVDKSGAVAALTDTGEIIRFRPGTGRLPATLEPLPIQRDEAGTPKWRWDTESLTSDPWTGQTWIGFEVENRICRYDASFLRVEGCAHPPAMQAWPRPTGSESLQRLGDGRFLAIAEEADGPAGPHDTLLFSGDPVIAGAPPPRRLSYRAPEGYLPSDALWLGGDRLLMLNRRVTLGAGFTAVLTLVTLDRESPVLSGPVVARLEGPLPHDNWEALALSYEQGQPILWVASDDNHLFFQRTLLLKLALPEAWVAGR